MRIKLITLFNRYFDKWSGAKYREAADKDYQITVLEDAVGDRSDDKHDFIIEQILNRSCEIESVESWRNHL